MTSLKNNSKLNKDVEKAVKDIKKLGIKDNILYKATRRIYDRTYISKRKCPKKKK